MSLALLGSLTVAESVKAQVGADPGSPAAAPAVTPPRLVKFVEATFPEGAVPPEGTSVMTELAIDERGRVVDATFVGASGGGPSEATGEAAAAEEVVAAVLAAVRQFEFEPARQGEIPVGVKIRYRYVVAPPAPQPESGPETAPASEPPSVPAPAEPAESAESAAPAAPGKGAGEGAGQEVGEEELEEFTGTAEVEAPPREVTKRTIGKEQLTRIPGTRGDALKAIEVLPGVARTFGDPLIRGASWNESGTFLDGIRVPFLFHLGGTSFMNSRLLEEVTLYPSNYSTRFGQLSGGIIEVKTRDPRLDGLHGVLDLNLIDSSVLVEAPLGEKTGIALAARRSNIDFFFENFVPEDAYSVLAAPVYWDYQGMVAHGFGGGAGSDHRLKVMAYGSRDSIELLFSDPNDEDPALAGSIGGTVEFHRLQTSLRSKLSSTATQDLTLAFGYIDIEQRFGELIQEVDGPEVLARGEWGFELMPEVRMTTGLDFNGWFAHGSYRGPQPGATEGGYDLPLAAQRMVSLEDDVTVVRPGAYLEFGLRPAEDWLFVPGVRADYYEDVAAWTVDPRLTARWDVAEKTALKAGVGIYSQPAEYWQALPGIGNEDIQPYHALQTSAGVEQRLGDHVKLGVEGFYKWLYDRVTATPDGRAPYYTNDGEGRIVGGEFSAEITPREGTFAYLAYTLSRSERRDLDERWRVYDGDQPHILTLAAGHDLGKGWEVGARFRLVSGNPQTPIVGSVFDARSGVYVPVYGANNSERNPMFQQLDIRVEKEFRVGPGSLAVYLDLQNAYNAQNQEGVRYSFDYRESEAVTGLPILPNLGLRGEL